MDYNVTTCPEDTITLEQAFEDAKLSSEDRKGVLHCYCLSEYNSSGRGIRNIEFEDGEYY